jgi:hypothetical protein
LNPALKTLSFAAAGLAAVTLYGKRRWNNSTDNLRIRLDAERELIHPQTVDLAEIDSLPPPVQRYFRSVFKAGTTQPMISGVHVRHKGSFNLGEDADTLKRFTSQHKILTRRPGFDWNAQIIIMPGLPVWVHDAYVAGEGILRASLLGLFPLADLQGKGDVAEGELMRFLAEAAWYPTALLPSQGICWSAMDDHSASATLRDGSVSATLLFIFNEQGLIDRVRAAARGRTAGGHVIPTPWQGRFWNYVERNGMLIPLNGEAAWLLPEGEKSYWRGEITGIAYEFA